MSNAFYAPNQSGFFIPRWYQNEADFAIHDYFDNGGKGHPIVAMPCGTGKSLVIAEFVRKCLMWWPHFRVMMLTHVKELIEQNAEKLLAQWPHAPLGIHSAGLNSREIINAIVFGGIQSVAPTIKKALETDDGRPPHLKHFGWRDIIIIDECHLLSPDDETMYRYVIAIFMTINPNLKVIGFTATPYRLKLGMLTDGGIFTDIVYDITGIEAFNRLIAEGYMSPIVAKPTKTIIDLSNVSVRNNEFDNKQVNAVVDTDEVTFSAVREVIEHGQDRNCWLIFAAGVENAEHLNAVFQSFGVESTCVHSKLKKNVNTDRINDFKNGGYRALVNNNKLTTGFDHPPIDLIGDLQPTISTGKHVQKYGRGTRPFAGNHRFGPKINCLGLDFATNVARLGPINCPKIPNKPGPSGGDLPVRICEACGMYNHAAARRCGGGKDKQQARINGGCGEEFTFESKLFATAGFKEIIAGDQPKIEYFTVTKVIHQLHEKRNKEGVLISPPSIKVSYFCGIRMFNEWVHLEGKGLILHRAREWWRQRHAEEPPITTHQALQRITELRWPARIRVHVNKTYPEVLSYEF